MKKKYPETHKMIVLSSAHVTENTARAMSANEAAFIYYEKGDYGWFLPVMDADYIRVTRESGFEDVGIILEYAAAQGCTWVMLDADADTCDDLPSYDW